SSRTGQHPRAARAHVRQPGAREGGAIRRRVHRDATIPARRGHRTAHRMKLSVLIVDDEQPARERLRSLLAEIGNIDVAGEAWNGSQTLRMVNELTPDVVLLDVRMPGMDGIEAARHLNLLEEPPAVIFTTAYDQYAINAF